MAESIISYDKDLPDIPGPRPWEKLTSFLVKDPATATGWRTDESCRRPSRLLSIPKLHAAVDQWRDNGSPAASDVYQRLEKDFGSIRIFHALPLMPPEWRGPWSQKVILRGESTEDDLWQPTRDPDRATSCRGSLRRRGVPRWRCRVVGLIGTSSGVPTRRGGCQKMRQGMATVH